MEFISALTESDKEILSDMIESYASSNLSEYERQVLLTEFVMNCISRYENEALDTAPKMKVFKEGDLTHFWDTFPLESLLDPFTPPEDISIFEKKYIDSSIRYEDYHHLFLRQSMKKCTKMMVLEWDPIHSKPLILSKLEGTEHFMKFIFHINHVEGTIRFELPVFGQLIEFLEYSLSMGEKFVFIPTYIYWSETLEKLMTHITYVIFDIQEFKYYYFDPNSNISHWGSGRLFDKFEFEFYSIFQSFKWSGKTFDYQFTSTWRNRSPLQVISPYAFDKGNCNIITLIFGTIVKRSGNISETFYSLVYKSDLERINMYYRFIDITII